MGLRDRVKNLVRRRTPVPLEKEIYNYWEKNNFFKPHVDHGSDHPRTISLIYLLNNDYEGGDLIFFDQTKNNEEYVVEKKANRAIIFPSNFIFKHTVTPVKKGTRFSIVGWGL